MRSLLLLSCLVLCASAAPGYAPYPAYGAGYHGPPAPLAHDGRVIDTPEVAHAKAAHLAAHAAEASKAASLGYSGDYVDGKYDDYGASYVGAAQNAYHGPPAPLAHDGRVIDTPEVAHAKAAHLAAHAEQISKIAHLSYAEPYPQPHWIDEISLDRRTPRFDKMMHYLVLLSVMLNVAFCAPQWYGGGHAGGYGGHAAPAPLGPDGRVVDTPEVAQLKAAHLAALADANARAPKGLGPAGAYPGPAGSYAPAGYGAHYSGPPAPLGPDGRVVDTAEVQQAKAVHFSLYNAEAQRAPAGPAGPAAPAPHNPSWNPAGGYNPSWGQPNNWNQY
ncbi:uncharacterized protein LOC143377061 [Andrena cerasifolii]|uniref:uncharacterized protein LOC143377061 n=1 Tax=Andrena cerasifolii TaxID=2819439 RepID=UPI0040383FC4